LEFHLSHTEEIRRRFLPILTDINPLVLTKDRLLKISSFKGFDLPAYQILYLSIRFLPSSEFRSGTVERFMIKRIKNRILVIIDVDEALASSTAIKDIRRRKCILVHELCHFIVFIEIWKEVSFDKLHESFSNSLKRDEIRVLISQYKEMKPLNEEAFETYLSFNEKHYLYEGEGSELNVAELFRTIMLPVETLEKAISKDAVLKGTNNRLKDELKAVSNTEHLPYEFVADRFLEELDAFM